MGWRVPLVLVASLLVSGSAQPLPKAAGTKAQEKINSQLLVEIEHTKSGASSRSKRGLVSVDERQRALVDVRATVTFAMTRAIVDVGGTLVSTSPEWDSIIAWVPLLKLETLAEGSAVRAIEPAASATTNRPLEKAKP